MLVQTKQLSRSQTAGRCVVARAATSNSSSKSRWHKAASVVLSTGLAASVLLAGVPVLPAQALTAADRAEQQAQILRQKEKLEFALQLQENARKAAILAREQQLQSTVTQVETAIQRKLIEEQANQQAAAAKGLQERAARIEAEAELIKAQEAAVQAAAAKAEAQLAQAGIAEKAREVQDQQSVDKTTGSMLEMLGLTQSDLGL